jgi:ribonuclease P protein component
MNEADLPAKRTQTGQDPRISQADVDQGRTRRDPVAPGEGTPAAVGVTTGPRSSPLPARGVGSIRSRRTFEALRRQGTRGRSGPLAISFLTQPTWSEAKVAYAVSRRVGGAVVRNRLKRRLRAIVSERATSLPAGAYVVQVGPGGSLLEFDELKVAMGQALEKATRGPSRRSSTKGPHRQGVDR